MNYYLAGGVIKVSGKKVNNSGKDPFLLLLWKIKLEIKPQFTYCPGLLSKEEVYYFAKVLILANCIRLFLFK